MSTTLLTVVSLCTFFVLWFICCTLFLLWSTRKTRLLGTNLSRAILAMLAILVLQIITALGFALVRPQHMYQAVLLLLFETSLAVVLPSVVIMTVFRSRFIQSLMTWILTSIPSICATVLVISVIQALVFQIYRNPVRNMEPTLIPNDRIMVNKLMKPRRWDIVTFRYPGDPSEIYMMRVVGLPGETIVLKNGSVFINDRLTEFPGGLQGIRYETDLTKLFPGMSPITVWGDESSPAALGPNEYFVLGDNPTTNDSRMWNEGAPGHAPYALPESYLEGVVTHIYWPLNRLRTLR